MWKWTRANCNRIKSPCDTVFTTRSGGFGAALPGNPPPASSLRTLSALRVARYRQTGTLPGCPLNAQQKRNARLAGSNSITGALFFSTKNTVVLLSIRQFPLRETEFEAGFFAKETAPEHLPPEGSPSNCVGTSRKLACGRVGDAIRGRGGKYSGAYRFNQRRQIICPF